MRAPRHHYSWHQYLVLEETSTTKHEFFNGEIFAMAGGTPEHSALKVAVVSALHSQLKGKGCRVYDSDLRVRVLATGLATYPDASVVCGPAQFDPTSRETLVNPTLLVEVLSDSTESYDRQEKFENYQQIPSLQEYLLISSRERKVELFRRANQWRVEATCTGKANLSSIGCTLEVDALYAEIELPGARA